MRRLVVAAVLGSLCGVLSGCGQPVDPSEPPAGLDPNTSPVARPDRADQHARLEEQARQALARWAEEVAEHGGDHRFVPVEDGVGVIGVAKDDFAENFKVAVMAAAFDAPPGVLPAGDPGNGEVHWADGRTASVPLLSAEATLHAMRERATGYCGRFCTPLRITSARLVTATVRTDRGEATAPAWEYTLDGTQARVTMIAVAPSSMIIVTPPPWNATNPPIGLRPDSATVAADDRTVTVHFVGSPEGTGPCNADYTARSVESEHAAVIIIEEHQHPHPTATVMACTLAGHPRTATLTLAAPLGQRTLLEVMQGMPIQTTR